MLTKHGALPKQNLTKPQVNFLEKKPLYRGKATFIIEKWIKNSHNYMQALFPNISGIAVLQKNKRQILVSVDKGSIRRFVRRINRTVLSARWKNNRLLHFLSPSVCILCITLKLYDSFCKNATEISDKKVTPS